MKITFITEAIGKRKIGLIVPKYYRMAHVISIQYIQNYYNMIRSTVEICLKNRSVGYYYRNMNVER